LVLGFHFEQQNYPQYWLYREIVTASQSLIFFVTLCLNCFEIQLNSNDSNSNLLFPSLFCSRYNCYLSHLLFSHPPLSYILSDPCFSSTTTNKLKSFLWRSLFYHLKMPCKALDCILTSTHCKPFNVKRVGRSYAHIFVYFLLSSLTMFSC
jgi:hypothetical protein